MSYPRLTKEERAEIAKRAEKATPGPWISKRGAVWGDRHISERTGTHYLAQKVADTAHHAQGGFPEQYANAEFIAHAREDIPDLLHAIDEIERERDARIVGSNVLSRLRVLRKQLAEREAGDGRMTEEFTRQVLVLLDA